jgi:GntR family transcriptional regulator, transcriptional repressor for pyruvate dehydrogenase complex
VRVAEAVAAQLRDRILASNDDGYRLPTQDQLVAEFGVSYPSVREAIRILETENLVTVQRGKIGGAVIHRPDETSAAYHIGLALQSSRITLGDLAGGLLLLEPLCAAACAQREDRLEAIVPALRANLEESAEVVDEGPAFTRTARCFHELVVDATPNSTTRFVVGSLVELWSAQELLWAESRASVDAYPSQSESADVVKAHRRILRAIEAGRATSAENAAREHLTATQKWLEDRFDDVVVSLSSARAIHAEVPVPHRL